MSQALGLLLETPAQPGECVWPWRENSGGLPAGGVKRKRFNRLGAWGGQIRKSWKGKDLLYRSEVGPVALAS